ncbi:2-dehydropantoate 2-reductase [Terrilactibacillus sp. BCM23-1]|uniref:2-dehydropantoate 2-reductase n=1 Tax=Terrilactibacillus tamarindi TaxID=2599694 RepID=A0A6N8CPV1_9BACI|nr:ketopantoate reductase family protein [Terrilactibacillus tamarindi]MTT31123.1 2-dehydropantoate 2-reductase [Terrilactibacillus tamarindi]
MKVAIIGLGAIGCTLLPYLKKEIQPSYLRIVAGGERKKRLETQGILINNEHYNLNVVSPETDMDPADLVIVAVKYNQLNQAIKDIKNQVGKNTIILSLMNGITSEEEIAEVYGKEKVIYGFTTINGIYKKGVATFSVGDNKIIFGSDQQEDQQTKVQRVKELFDACHIPYEIPNDIIRELWLKFLLNVSGNSVAGVLRAQHKHFQKLDSANKARECIMREVIALSKAMGTGLVDEDLEAMKSIYFNYEPEGRGSMVQDILSKRPTENEMLCGTVVKLGKKYGVSTPATELLYYLIKAIDDETNGLLD